MGQRPGQHHTCQPNMTHPFAVSLVLLVLSQDVLLQPLPSVLQALGQVEQQGKEPDFKQEIVSFENFANEKEDLLTLQSETLEEEMKKLEEQLAEKLNVLEDKFKEKEEEEKTFRKQIMMAVQGQESQGTDSYPE